jgi:hypothetical protein
LAWTASRSRAGCHQELMKSMNMKKQVIRRAVIREWMALPRDKR